MIRWDPASITFHLIDREEGGRRREGVGREGEWWRNNGADWEESVSSVETKLTVIYLLFSRDNIHFRSTNNKPSLPADCMDSLATCRPVLLLSLSLSLLCKYYLSKNDSSVVMWSHVQWSMNLWWSEQRFLLEPHPDKVQTFSCRERSLIEVSSWVLIVNIIMLILPLSFSYHLIKLKLNGDHKIVENV